MDIQDKVNEFAKLLRVQIIEALIKEDCIKYGAEIPDPWKLNFMVESVDKLKCCTRKLRTLFKDAHQYHEDIGMFPHAATIADLEYCMDKRFIGFSCEHRIPLSWLPYKEDEDLRRLPAFRKLAEIYKPLIAQGKKILPPINKNAVVDEAQAIINQVAQNITIGA